MNHEPVILIIIPVYNEMESIRAVICELLADSYRNIIVVDDGSNQHILGVINDLPVHYIRHHVNLGQGAALQTGFDFARQVPCDVVITFDADGQHSVQDLVGLAAPVLSGQSDIVFGSRFLTNANDGLPRFRKLILKCACFVNYLFSGLLLSDAHNGLRAMHPKVLRVVQLTENRMAHATEILSEVKKLKLRYCEVAVNIRYSSYSKSKGQRDWNSIRIFSDLVLHKLFRSSSK